MTHALYILTRLTRSVVAVTALRLVALPAWVVLEVVCDVAREVGL